MKKTTDKLNHDQYELIISSDISTKAYIAMGTRKMVARPSKKSINLLKSMMYSAFYNGRIDHNQGVWIDGTKDLDNDTKKFLSDYLNDHFVMYEPEPAKNIKPVIEPEPVEQPKQPEPEPKVEPIVEPKVEPEPIVEPKVEPEPIVEQDSKIEYSLEGEKEHYNSIFMAVDKNVKSIPADAINGIRTIYYLMVTDKKNKVYVHKDSKLLIDFLTKENYEFHVSDQVLLRCTHLLTINHKNKPDIMAMRARFDMTSQKVHYYTFRELV